MTVFNHEISETDAGVPDYSDIKESLLHLRVGLNSACGELNSQFAELSDYLKELDRVGVEVSKPKNREYDARDIHRVIDFMIDQHRSALNTMIERVDQRVQLNLDDYLNIRVGGGDIVVDRQIFNTMFARRILGQNADDYQGFLVKSLDKQVNELKGFDRERISDPVEFIDQVVSVCELSQVLDRERDVLTHEDQTDYMDQVRIESDPPGVSITLGTINWDRVEHREFYAEQQLSR